jgi:putative tricarboxylic transport membrane protein
MRTIRSFGALVWIGLSGIVCIDSFRTGIGTFRSPGSGFFPFWLGLVLVGLAVALAAIEFIRGEKRTDLGKKSTRWHAVAGVMILTLLYSLVLKPLGYLTATFVLMTMLFYMAERKKIWRKTILAGVVVSLSYLVFQYWLKVSLPEGILYF